MFNLTLYSLTSSFILSSSPLYTVNHNYHPKYSYIFNSHFSHSYSNIIFSNTKYHSTILDNNVFKNILDNALYFASYTCQDNSQCCVSYEYDFQVGKSISFEFRPGKFPNNLANSGGSDKHAIFIGGCGDILITKSSFIDCFTQTKSGGGLLIEQYCKVILHNTVFDKCYSAADGGAGAIAKQIKVENAYPCHELTHKLDIQYTCFQSCYSLNPGFGTALLMGAEDVTFYYASTVDCPKHDAQNNQAWGAQFDILADSISSQYVNATGGNSIYCGAMEYRKATSGFFRFQTITKMNCKYAISFTEVDINNLTITTCNIFENSVHRAEGHDDDRSNPPSLVFVQKKNLLIEDFYFSKNNLNGIGKLTSKENVDNINIILRNCYADTGNSGDWSNSYVTTENCHFSNEPIETCSILQLNLGSCQGQITPGLLIITSLFTNSKVFSESTFFSNSNEFSYSEKFTKSNDFSNSAQFTKTDGFTCTEKFTKTDFFTKTDLFTKTNLFSESNDFTFSGTFTSSLHFDQSRPFTPSKTFTPTKKFSKSSEFSNSIEFSESIDFSQSFYFSNSKYFSKSDEFSYTNYFSKSKVFSSTDFFSFSDDFTCSKIFSDSQFFTQSNTIIVRHSNTFSKSLIFSKSIEFSFSNIFDLDDGNNSGSSNKTNKGVIIGAVVGSVAAAAIIAGLVAFFIIRKRRLPINDDANIMKETNSSITVDNALKTVMDKDDPFANDFNNELQDI